MQKSKAYSPAYAKAHSKAFGQAHDQTYSEACGQAHDPAYSEACGQARDPACSQAHGQALGKAHSKTQVKTKGNASNPDHHSTELATFSMSMPNNNSAAKLNMRALLRTFCVGTTAFMLCSGCVSVPNPATGAGDSAATLYVEPHPMTEYVASDEWPPRPVAHLPKHRTPRGAPPPHNFLPMPVAKGFLTSGHGLRTHPTNSHGKRYHKGIDYAAPAGTDVFAAGDGVVVRKYNSGSYGLYLKIKHNNGYETAYAHLNSFAQGIKVGSNVTQGQPIGQVGSTGRSTGPHLHFELIYKGKFVDPLYQHSKRAEAKRAANLNSVSSSAG